MPASEQRQPCSECRVLARGAPGRFITGAVHFTCSDHLDACKTRAASNLLASRLLTACGVLASPMARRRHYHRRRRRRRRRRRWVTHHGSSHNLGIISYVAPFVAPFGSYVYCRFWRPSSRSASCLCLTSRTASCLWNVSAASSCDVRTRS
jgi:hypothetical protein